MGVQPGTLQAGLVAATASTDTTAPDLDDHVARSTAPTVAAGSRSRSPAPPPTSAADGGQVGGVEVSVDGGSDLASGRRAAQLDLLVDAQRAAGTRHDQGPRRRRQRQPRGARAPASRSTSSPRTCPCSIWDDIGHRDRRTDDTNAVELGVKFRSDVAGFITGLRFYKTAGNTGTHIGHLWTAGGTQLGTGHVHRRDRVRLAGGRLRRPGGDQRRTPPTSPPITRRTATTRRARLLRERRRRQRRRCTRLPTGSTGRTASTSTGRPAAVLRRGPDTFSSTNYWVDVVFRPTSGRTRRRRRSPPASPATGATGVADHERRHRDLQRADGCRHDQRHRPFQLRDAGERARAGDGDLQRRRSGR